MSKRNSGSSINGKGYYIALILCAVAIGITGYLYYRNTDDTEQQLQNEPSAVVEATGDGDVQAVATQTDGTATEGTGSTEEKDTRPAKRVSPVTGETVAQYAVDTLSYNQTTRDWRVHNGVDLAAEDGAEVCAAADGEVYTVYEDDALGYTVVIRHNDGYTTKYSSLREDLTVKAGDTVTMGQTIGYAADSAIVESTLGCHVHFSVSRYDEPMDPAEFLALGQ